VYKILAALGIVGGSALLVGYGLDQKPGTQGLAVAGVAAIIVGVLAALVSRDAKRSVR
jgi:hypothetical protein